jgi:NitT/TauT family transport system substrate-binding protein
MVELLKETYMEGNRDFLNALDPAFVARDLVDDSFVKNAIHRVGGMKVFGQPESFTRTEIIDA